MRSRSRVTGGTTTTTTTIATAAAADDGERDGQHRPRDAAAKTTATAASGHRYRRRNPAHWHGHHGRRPTAPSIVDRYARTTSRRTGTTAARYYASAVSIFLVVFIATPLSRTRRARCKPRIVFDTKIFFFF